MSVYKFRLKANAYQVLTLATLMLLAVGCGDSNPAGRFRVAGTVSYQGQPVPAGQVRFEPDTKQGGKGPVGFAIIRDGKFDSQKLGKGPVQGPARIVIRGYVSDKPGAAQLFPEYKENKSLSSDENELAFEIPSK